MTLHEWGRKVLLLAIIPVPHIEWKTISITRPFKYVQRGMTTLRGTQTP